MDKAWFSLAGFKQHVLKLAVISMLQAGAIVAQAMLLAIVINGLFQGDPVKDVMQPLLLFIVVYVARQSFVWIQQRVAGSFAERRSEEEREQLVRQIFHGGPQFVARENSGQLVTLVMEGVDRFRTYLEMSIPRMIDTPIVTLVILCWTYRLDVVSGVILTVTLPVIVVFFIVLGLAARKQADRQWGTFRKLAHHFADSLRGMETLLALGKSREHGQQVALRAEHYRKAVMRTLRVAFLSSLSLDVFSMLAIASVAVGLGLRLIDGSIDFYGALAVLLLAPEYFAPIRQLGSDYHASLDGKESWASLKAMTRKAQNIATLPMKSEVSVASHTQSVLQFHGVSLKSDEGDILLKNVDLLLEPHNRWIGIAGASGAGKSTLLGLIGGFQKASEGEIWLNGAPLGEGEWVQWRSQIAYIPQHPHLFSMSLADNIRFYEPEASMNEVRRAIEEVGLSNFVKKLPNGLDEQIGEGGRGVSGGEAQRIALARALVSKRPIVLLDEPTAHLDVETEWELKQTLINVLADKRVIMATHRLHWMKEMHQVWVIEKGQLVECGTHEELRQRGGAYTRMLQYRDGRRSRS